MWMISQAWSYQCRGNNYAMLSMQSSMPYIMYSHHKPRIVMNQYLRKIEEGQRNVRYQKNIARVWFWWGHKNHVACKTKDIADYPQRMDTHWDARILGDPVWKIRIYCCKNTACVHKHPGRKGSTLAVQPITTEAPGVCLFESKPGCLHSAGEVSDLLSWID